MFREARPAGPAWNVTKTLLQTCVFWGVFLFVVPWALGGRGAFAPQPRLGVALFAVASAVGLASAWTMATRGEGTPLPLDHPRRLVVTGPYRVVRNPMAVAGLAQGWAVGLFLGSYVVLAYCLAGAVVWHFGVRPFEERHLLATFGGEYEDYRRRVRCWLPRF
jgi:protein-S-isoprenylcysteine O-methyltransferase Ste14